MKRRPLFKALQNGITLVEVMVVLGIVGVVTAIGLPSYQRMIEGNRLKQAAEMFKADVQFARTQALKISEDVAIVRSGGENGAWCYGLTSKIGSPRCNCAQTNSAQSDFCEIRRVSGNQFSKTSLRTDDNGTSTFSFRRGTANASGVTFYTDHYAVRIRMSNVGRVILCTDLDTAPAGKTGLSGVIKCSEYS